jgi:mRNA-degrading endonuclease RelE of RelBE toxin-antitoxin system
MAKYEVVITTSVQKYLDKLPDKLADKLEKCMMKLEDNPRPLAQKKCLAKTLIVFALEIIELFILFRIRFY